MNQQFLPQKSDVSIFYVPSAVCPPSLVGWSVLSCSGTISGQITDAASGDELSDVNVWAESFETGSFGETVSDGTGRFVISSLEPANDYCLFLSSGSWSNQLLEGINLGNEGQFVRPKLCRKGALEGVVVSAEGIALENASITWARADNILASTGSVVSGPDGKFCICDMDVDSIDFGSPFVLLTEHPDYSYDEQHLTVPPNLAGSDIPFVQISLQKLGSLTARVTVDLAPAEDIPLYLAGCDDGLLTDTSNYFTGSDGNVVLNTSAPHTYSLIVQGDGTSLERRNTSILESDATEISIPLDGPGQIAGTVINLAGDPVASVLVELLTPDGTGPVWGISATSDSDGNFSLLGVPPDVNWIVRASVANQGMNTGFPQLGTFVHSRTIVPVNVTVDTIPPDVQIVSPIQHSVVWSVVEVQCQVQDNQGVYAAMCFVDDDCIGLLDSSQSEMLLLDGTGTFQFDTNSVENGDHVITVQAFDLCGNDSETSVTVTVSN